MYAIRSYYAVDIMVVGTLMSIQFAVLYALLVPILLVTVAVTMATLILLRSFPQSPAWRPSHKYNRATVTPHSLLITAPPNAFFQRAFLTKSGSV